VPDLTVIVDGANVVGSRPDGWWRDRAGAAERLRRSLEPLTSVPGDVVGWPEVESFPARVVLVLEGQAKGAGLGASPIETVLAPREGDDEIVAQAKIAVSRGDLVLVATADRALIDRIERAGAQTITPTRLRNLAEA